MVVGYKPQAVSHAGMVMDIFHTLLAASSASDLALLAVQLFLPCLTQAAAGLKAVMKQFVKPPGLCVGARQIVVGISPSM